MPEITEVSSLSPEMLNEFFSRIQKRERMVGKKIKKGVKNSTIKTQHAKLNVFFKWLHDKGYIEHNPLQKIKPPSVNYDDFRRLTDSDVHRLYSAITQYSVNPLLLRRDTVIVSLLLMCGLRKGELVSLRVSDIDLGFRTITIRGETSKSKKTRTLSLHPTLLMHLKDYMEERKKYGLKTEHLLVANKRDTGLTVHGLKHWTKGITKKSGVKVHLHQFRHTFACKLAEKNVNAFNIQKMMGHTNISMTMKYTRSLQAQDMGDEIAKICF